jgi:hypothetical protein
MKAQLASDERLEERLALDEGKPRDVAAVEVQEVERVMGETGSAFAIRRRLGVSEARKSRFINSAEHAVEIGGLHVQVRERGDGARIFVGPIKSGSGQSCTRPLSTRAAMR